MISWFTRDLCGSARGVRSHLGIPSPQPTRNIISAAVPSWGNQQDLKLQELYESGDINPQNLNTAYLWAKTAQHGKEGDASDPWRRADSTPSVSPLAINGGDQ